MKGCVADAYSQGALCQQFTWALANGLWQLTELAECVAMTEIMNAPLGYSLSAASLPGIR